MNIIFIGQRGIPAQLGHDTEKRVENLARLLAQQGHKVTITCENSYSATRLRRFGTMELLYRGSFARLRNLMLIWRRQPNVVHIQGWKTALFVRLAAILSPQTTYIWTVSELPAHTLRTKLAIRNAKRLFDAITTPSRQLQYQLLLRHDLRTSYIPDGYSTPVLKDIPAKQWGLRAGQYCVTMATSLAELRWVVRAYSQLKTRKKLVTLLPESPELRRLQKRHTFLVSVMPLGERAQFSLLRQASAVIFDAASPAEEILQTMDAKRPVIAVRHEEVMGTTGSIVKQGDVKGLAEALKAAMSSKKMSASGTKARQRARRHFQWTRIVDEYIALYHYPFVRRVPLDSVLPKNVSQTRAIAH